MKHSTMAQWAVNAVDFRDVDAIMTPFEFDINPFNGWDVDGIIGTADDAHADRAIVWGCERPELLISESIVFHDRRTEDLDDEQPNGGQQAALIGQMGEMDNDQRLLPRERPSLKSIIRGLIQPAIPMLPQVVTGLLPVLSKCDQWCLHQWCASQPNHTQYE